MSFAKFLPAAVALMLGASSASADVAMANAVAYWNQFGQTGSQISTVGVGATGVTVADMVRGAGLTGNTGSGSLNSKGWSGETSDYVEFGFTVGSGFVASLDKLYIGSKASGTGPKTVNIFTSLDSYAKPIAAFAEDGTNFVNSAIDLSGLGPVAGTLTFRLFGSGATSAAGTLRVTDYVSSGAYYYDTITGNVAAVPEPETYALMLAGLGMLGVAARRRGK